MMPDDILRRHFIDLARKAFSQGRYTYSSFLSGPEQDALRMTAFDASCAQFTLYGGYDGAERKIAVFGGEELCGYAASPPIACVRISPVSKGQKFADALTHRDYLGAVMSLGVERRVIGDIVSDVDAAYLFCLDTAAVHIADGLDTVRRTSVTCRIVEGPPELAREEPEPLRVNVASERLDAVLAAVYKLPREKSQELVTRGLTSVNGAIEYNPDRRLSERDAVSARGCGKLIYDGVLSRTKKGRLNVAVRVYGKR